MECQVDKNEHFRHHLLFAFNRGAKATEAAREICAVYGEGAIAERTARYWFAKFKSGEARFSSTEDNVACMVGLGRYYPLGIA